MTQHGRFLSSVRLIAFLTLVSRILGLCREAVFGYFFAASELMSAFRIAFMIPNLARRLFGEGALSAALIPTLSAALEKDGEESSRRFLGSLLAAVAAILVAAVIVAELFIGGLRGLNDSTTLRLTAILMPYMALICFVAVLSSVLHVRKRFGLPAAMPMVLNVSILLGAICGAKLFGLAGERLMYVVCVSILAAGVMQLAAVSMGVWRTGLVPIWKGRRQDARVRMVVCLMGPAIVGLSTVQLNSLADYLIAYFFVSVDGERIGPAVLGYAHYLYQLPLGVFGIAIATALFPELSRKAARRDMNGLAADVSQGVRLAVFVALPATIGLMFVAKPLVAALLEHGRFGDAETARVSATLIFYCIGLCAYFVQHVLVRTFHALQDTRTPARAAMWMVLLNIVLNLSLVQVMEERGLALSTSVCAILQVLWLGRRLRQQMPELAWKHAMLPVAKTVAAAAIMGVALTVVHLSRVQLGSFLASPVWELVVMVTVGVGSFVAAAFVLGAEELRLLLPRIRKTEGAQD